MSKQKLLVKTQLLILLLKALACIPKPIAWQLASGVALVMRKLRTRSACTTEENLTLALPQLNQQERAKLTQASLSHTIYMVFELAKVWTKPWEQVNAEIEIDSSSRELVDDALAGDRGVVYLVPHLGNWELLGFRLHAFSPLVALYQPSESAALNELILDRRQSLGAKVLPTNRHGVMGIFKFIKQGGTTGILPDQVPEKSGGEFAPFFGVQAFTMTLIFNLIRRTNCRVLMATCLRTKSGFDFVVAEPHPEIYSEDLATSLAAMNQSIEQLVMRAPEQYQWEYKRYRRLMPGEAKRYVRK